MPNSRHTAPFRRTLPALMYSSASRREQTPACAINLLRRRGWFSSCTGLYDSPVPPFGLKEGRRRVSGLGRAVVERSLCGRSERECGRSVRGRLSSVRSLRSDRTLLPVVCSSRSGRECGERGRSVRGRLSSVRSLRSDRAVSLCGYSPEGRPVLARCPTDLIELFL